MAIEEKQQTPEERAAARAAQGDKAKSILEEIKDGLPADQSLRSGDEGRMGKAEDEEGEEEEQDDSQETEDGEESEEESDENAEDGEGEESEDEESSEEGEAEEEGEEGDEEDALDPKSKAKVQKRIDKLTLKNKRLENELRALREKGPAPEKSSDPDVAKLEAMSEEELKKVSEAIEDQREDAILAGDKEKAKALRVLSAKAQSALRSAPERFQSTQIGRFNAAVVQTAEAFEEAGQKLDQAAYDRVFARAKKIFTSSKTMMRSVDGQAEAWSIAVEQDREVSKFSAGNSRRLEAERKVNKLKKKVALSTATQKGNSKVSEEAKLYGRAKNGTNKDKAAFVRKAFNTDSLIPSQFRKAG